MSTKPDPKALAAAVASLDTGNGPSSLYGTNSDVLGTLFSVDGLPGLTDKKNPTGKDVIQAFLAAGQSSDPATRNLVSAIEYALYQSNYYTSETPNLYEVTGHDAEALGRALQDLSQVNQTSAGATAEGGVQRMSLSQFLTSQAALAAANGPGSPGAATTQQTQVRTPNPADVAAEYRRVAAGLEGKNPSNAETQAFVNQYLRDYVNTASGATASNYQQQAAQAQAQQLAGVAPAGPVQPVEPANDPNASPFPPGMGERRSVGNAEPPPTENLTDAMSTLQDVLGQNSSSVDVSTDPESVTTAAESFARNANPGAVHENELGNTMDTFLKLITTRLV